MFIVNREPVDWYLGRDYQTWAYYDFIYDNNVSKNYFSQGSFHNIGDTLIDINNIAPGIIFRISRNINNSIYFERNDAYLSHSRISDNEWARLGYRGFYARITMDPGRTIIPPNSNKIQLPTGLVAIETNNEKDQCIMCVSYKVNIRFQPCNHSISCSECYKKMENNLCPVCKTEISNIIVV